MKQGFWLSPGESPANYPSGWTFVTDSPVEVALTLTRSWGGFGYESFVYEASDSEGELTDTGLRGFSVAFPLWFPAALFAVLPAARLYRRVRRKHPPGHCRRCGYDLRATLARCPECGMAGGLAGGR